MIPWTYESLALSPFMLAMLMGFKADESSSSISEGAHSGTVKMSEYGDPSSRAIVMEQTRFHILKTARTQRHL